MKGFIEVTCDNNLKHLINIHRIEQITQTSNGKCVLCFVIDNTSDLDEYYINLDESYNEVKQKIMEAK